MSLIPLPIRLAATSSSIHENTFAAPEDPVSYDSEPSPNLGPGPGPGSGPGPSLAFRPGGAPPPPPPLVPSPLIAENGDSLSISNGPSSEAPPHGAPTDFRIDAAAGSTNHQFWLKDAKIAEDLFTIQRSAKHLVEFTASMIGAHDPSLGHRPIPVMSDADVLFMTQLSNDIVRGVGGISAVRQHGMRNRKRKARDALAAVDPRLTKEKASHHRHSKGSREDRTSGAKRLQLSHVSKSEAELSCQKCGRTETPEWRKGPDGGLLCNVCGLMYAKQKKKIKEG